MQREGEESIGEAYIQPPGIGLILGAYMQLLGTGPISGVYM